MKCDLCGGQTEILNEQTWHYAEFGLDNVYLRKIEVRRCTACDAQSPRLPRINDLHATIERAVAELPTKIEERGEPLVVMIKADNPRVYSYLSAEQLASKIAEPDFV